MRVIAVMPLKAAVYAHLGRFKRLRKASIDDKKN